MEAVRPDKDEVTESPSQLFEGLEVSLPPAPTGRPDVQPKEEEVKQEVFEDPSTEGLLVPIAPTSSIEIEAQSSSANFRNLYGNILEENNSFGLHQSSGYPKLPSPRIAERSLPDGKTLLHEEDSKTEHMKESGDTPKLRPNVIEASAPALAASPTSYQYAQQQQVQQRVQQQQQESQDSIIAELVSENSRLNEEVQRLLQLVQASYNQEEGKSESPRPSPPIHQRDQQTQQSLHPLQRQHPHQAQTRQLDSQAQTAADKYVCCGNCRQWLQAPRTAMMVHCPTCGCVNNCELAHRRLESAQQPRPSQQVVHPPHLRHPAAPPQHPQAEQWQDMSYGNGATERRPRRLRGPLGFIQEIVGDCFAAFQEVGDRLLEPAAGSTASSYHAHSEQHGAHLEGGATAPMMHPGDIGGEARWQGHPVTASVAPSHPGSPSSPPPPRVEAVEMHPMMADAHSAASVPPQRPENALLSNSTVASAHARRADYY